MEERTMTFKPRTREEIIAWWRRARERKEAFQRETDEIFAREEMLRKQVAASHYYDIPAL